MVKNTELEKKIPDVSGFLLTSVFNSKITEVENKVPYVSNLVTKTDYAEEDKISKKEKKILMLVIWLKKQN